MNLPVLDVAARWSSNPSVLSNAPHSVLLVVQVTAAARRLNVLPTVPTTIAAQAVQLIVAPWSQSTRVLLVLTSAALCVCRPVRHSAVRHPLHNNHHLHHARPVVLRNAPPLVQVIVAFSNNHHRRKPLTTLRIRKWQLTWSTCWANYLTAPWNRVLRFVLCSAQVVARRNVVEEQKNGERKLKYRELKFWKKN